MNLPPAASNADALAIAKIRQDRRRQSYVQIFLTLVVTGFFLFFAIKPTLNIVVSLYQEIKDKQLVESQMDNKIKALMLAQKQYQAAESYLDLLNEALPSTPELSLLLKQIEYFALQNSLRLETAQVDQTLLFGQEKGIPDFVAIALTVNGSYDNLKNLLAQINQTRRAFTIKSFSFKTDPKDNTQMQLTLNLKAYMFKE